MLQRIGWVTEKANRPPGRSTRATSATARSASSTNCRAPKAEKAMSNDPSANGTATALPFADGSFDIAFSAFGALQCVLDAERAVAEVARVLRPGGRFAFSVTHPIRWSMPDDPTAEGLVVTMSYFDRTPYVEQDEAGAPSYVEHHRTLGDWV